MSPEPTALPAPSGSPARDGRAGRAGRAGCGRYAGFAGYAAAAWGVLFALPSFYWAAGGLRGASTTVSPRLVELGEQRVAWFVAVLWVTGVLKVIGGAMGVALTRPLPPRPALALYFAGAGAGVLLAWHGALFVLQGIVVQSGLVHIAADLRAIDRWYTYLWGPWFLLGGLLFLAAVRVGLAADELPRSREAARYGALAALALSVLMLAGQLV